MYPKPSYEGGYLSLSVEQLSPSLLFCSNLNEVGTTKDRAGSSVANCCQFLPPDSNNAVQGSRMSLFIPFCGVCGLIGLVGSYCAVLIRRISAWDYRTQKIIQTIWLYFLFDAWAKNHPEVSIYDGFIEPQKTFFLNIPVNYYGVLKYYVSAFF